MSIVDSYIESTQAYKKVTNDKSCIKHKKKEEEKFLTYVLLGHSDQKVFCQRNWSSTGEGCSDPTLVEQF